MEVLLADEYGFCFGVERAVEMVEDVVNEGVSPIRSLGPLIHNAQEMERLGEKGVSTIDSPEEADADTIAVIRAHGVTPQVQHELEQRAAKVIDATCPFVTRVQHLAERAAREGAIPHALLVARGFDAKVERHAAQDQADQHQRHGNV